MSENSSAAFRIGLLGPSQVGKTSLVTALLAESQKMLLGSGIAMYPDGVATSEKLAQNRSDLESHLLTGQFQTEMSLTGTAEPFTFTLRIDPGAGEAGISVELLDFPGGWLTRVAHQPEAPANREVLGSFLADAAILLIPVDAVQLMEARTEEQVLALSRLAILDEMRAAVTEWAAERSRRPSEPALVAFCPVKCESYFTDNGGSVDQAAALREAVTRTYAGVLQAIKDTAPRVTILYAPVDTLGCVELRHGEWQLSSLTGELEFIASYQVRQPPKLTRAGASDVMRVLCRQLYREMRAASIGASTDLGERAEAAARETGGKAGIFRTFWRWLTGKRAALRKQAQAITQQAEAAAAQIAALDAIISKIAGTAYGPRVRELSHRTQVFLRTRGRSSDYQFLGQAPGEPWWRSYSEFTNLERPTVLMESDGHTWRAYLAAFRSAREDSGNRPIRYDLTLAGECDPAETDDHSLVLAIITTYTADAAESMGHSVPGDRLDAWLGAHDVEKLLNSLGPDTSARIAVAVRDAYRGIRAEAGDKAGHLPRRWIGGLGDPQCRADFTALARHLLAGEPGRALMLSYVETGDDAERIPAKGGRLGVLIAKPGRHFDAAERELA